MISHQNYQHLLSFLNNYEGLIQHFCDVQDGKFNEAKEQLRNYIEENIRAEDGKLKMHGNEDLHKKLIAFHTAVLEVLK